jgi:tetratricopeptide (TPR) repeat protein
MKPVVQQHPSAPDFACSLAVAYVNRGLLLRETKRPEEALKEYVLAISTLGPVHQQEPRLVVVRESLLKAYGGRAQAYCQMKQYAEAVKDYDRVVELAEGPPRDRLRLERAEVRMHVGEHQRAIAELKEVMDRAEASGQEFYNLAYNCSFSVRNVLFQDSNLAQADRKPLADEYVVLAIALLKKAHASGYFKDPAHVADLKKEIAFLWVSGRPEFQQLLRDLEAGAQPGGK